MTRLIDADKLNIYDVSPAYGTCVMGVTEEDIELAPTVDAIPVSLIQSEIDFLTLAAEGEMEVTGQHGEVYAELAELKKLMSLWENEREKQI